MAGHARYTALLDACVLYPLAMTDALLSLATAGFFAAKWTTRIECEWISALERQRPDLVGRLGVRRDSMRDAIADWEVPEAAWVPIARGIELPDPDDAHVLAAAIAGHADAIITSNLKDFPPEILRDLGIEVIDPDTFIVHCISCRGRRLARDRSQAAVGRRADLTASLRITAHRLYEAFSAAGTRRRRPCRGGAGGLRAPVFGSAA